MSGVVGVLKEEKEGWSKGISKLTIEQIVQNVAALPCCVGSE